MPEILYPGIYVEDIGMSGAGVVPGRTHVTALSGCLPDELFVANQLIEFSYETVGDAAVENWPNGTMKSAVQGYFLNGGTQLFLVNIGPDTSDITPNDLKVLDQNPDINLVAAPGYVDAASHRALIAHCEAHKGRFAVLDGPTMVSPETELLNEPVSSSGKAALYVPWVEVVGDGEKQARKVPPSGHVCGTYARNDLERGVWHAPANVALLGIDGLTQAFTNDEQRSLNEVNVNAIRAFDEQDYRIWGARTRAPKGHEMRYVPERRLLNMIEVAVLNGLEWTAFEENDEPLWAKVRDQIDGFLNILWRSGALVGQTAEQSFFVRCGVTTMTPADLDAGRLLCEIGVCMLKPGAFSVLKLELPVRSAPSA